MKIKKYIFLLISILLLTFTLVGNCAWLSGYDQRIKLTIDNSKIDSALSDFPVTVFFTSTQAEEIFSEFDADSDYMKCAFTLSDGTTQLYAEKELFDVSESKAIYHVKVTSISSSADTDIYYYYDNSASDNTTYIGGIDNSIDIGNPAINQLNNLTHTNYTFVDSTNPANSDGTIDTIECYSATALTGVYFGIFYVVSGNNLSTRDSVYIGNVAAGYNKFTDLNLTVKQGDYIGVHTANTNHISYNTSGGTNWQLSGDYIPCTNVTFDTGSVLLSMKGTGGTTTAGENVWDSNFKAVYHMADNTTSTVVDSTSNSNDGTKKAANEPIEAAGKVGQGQDFDGTDDKITVSDTADLRLTGNYTVSCILKPNTLKDYGNVFLKSTDGSSNGYGLITFADGHWNWQLHTGSWGDIAGGSTGELSNGSTSFLAITYDGTNVKTYHDTTLKTTVEKGAITSGTAILNIGADPVSSRFINGILDEIRISNDDRSAAWLKATYNSLWDSLVSYGSEETKPVEEKDNAVFFGMNF